MVTNELLVFIRESLQGGMSPSQVGVLLKDKGWPEIDIQQGLEMVLGRTISSEKFGVGGKLKGPIQLISESLQVIREHIQEIFIIGFLPYIVGALAQIVFEFIGYVTDPNSEVISDPLFLLFGVLFVIGGLFYVIWLMTSNYALIEFISHRREGLTVGSAYRRGVSRILSAWKVSFLTVAVTLGAYSFFFVPGIILGVYFTFAMFFVFDGTAKGTSALVSSLRLVKGYWWAVVGRNIIYGFIVFCVLVGLLIVVAIPAFALGYITGVGADSVIGLVFSVFVTPISSVVALVFSRMIYENLYALKGAIDLTVTTKEKLKYYLIALWGLAVMILVPIGLILVMFLAAVNPGDRIREAELQNREVEMHAIQTRLEMFYVESGGMYPVSLDELDGYEAGVFSFTYQVQADRGDYRLCYVGYEEDSICVTAEGDFGTSDLLN